MLRLTASNARSPALIKSGTSRVCFARAFAADCVFLNPIRDDTGKELADVMCITDDIILVVQAKDSPNTERALRRSIERKARPFGRISKRELRSCAGP